MDLLWVARTSCHGVAAGGSNEPKIRYLTRYTENTTIWAKWAPDLALSPLSALSTHAKGSSLGICLEVYITGISSSKAAL